jgi:hypothetical protein
MADMIFHIAAKEKEMACKDINIWYSRIFCSVVKSIDADSDLPVPWFTCKIWRDLQWTAYVGQCQGNDKCLAFGLNLENTPTWTRVRPRLELPRFQEIISSLDAIEWRWQGRPRQKMKNPPFEGGCPYAIMPANEVNVREWLPDLDAILSGRRTWEGGNLHGRLIRPHMQLMRRVAPASMEQLPDTVAANMRMTMSLLQPVVLFLSDGRAK